MENNFATAEELVTAIARKVKGDVADFQNFLIKKGIKSYYESTSPFTRRMMFFDYCPHTLKYLRHIVKEWLIYGEHKADCYRCDMFDNVDMEKRYEETTKLFGYGAIKLLKNMNEIRENILKENPILTDFRCSFTLRSNILLQALKLNKEYNFCEKSFQNFINRIVANIISKALGFDPWVSSDVRRIIEKA